MNRKPRERYVSMAREPLTLKGIINSVSGRRIILIIIIVGLLIWHIHDLSSNYSGIRYGIASTWNSLLQNFGWGIAIIIVWVAIIAWLFIINIATIQRRRRELFASIPFGLAILGLLAFFWMNDPILHKSTLGGEFGQWILGSPGALGIIRIVILAAIGFLLLFFRRVQKENHTHEEEPP